MKILFPHWSSFDCCNEWLWVQEEKRYNVMFILCKYLYCFWLMENVYAYVLRRLCDLTTKWYIMTIFVSTNSKELRNYSIPRSSLCESLNSYIIALPCSDSTLTYNVSVKSWKLFLSAIRFNINATCWLLVAILKRKAQGF